MNVKTLPHGTQKKLAKEFNVSESTIRNMLTGKYLHERQLEIFKRAIEIKKEYADKIDQLTKMQEELNN